MERYNELLTRSQLLKSCGAMCGALAYPGTAAALSGLVVV